MSAYKRAKRCRYSRVRGPSRDGRWVDRRRCLPRDSSARYVPTLHLRHLRRNILSCPPSVRSRLRSVGGSCLSVLLALRWSVGVCPFSDRESYLQRLSFPGEAPGDCSQSFCVLSRRLHQHGSFDDGVVTAYLRNCNTPQFRRNLHPVQECLTRSWRCESGIRGFDVCAV